MTEKNYDLVVIGSGPGGEKGAAQAAYFGKNVALIEKDNGHLTRSSYVNQARLHQGYHYPRSISTGIKTIEYYHRFRTEFSESINNNMEKINEIWVAFFTCWIIFNDFGAFR